MLGRMSPSVEGPVWKLWKPRSTQGGRFEVALPLYCSGLRRGQTPAPFIRVQASSLLELSTRDDGLFSKAPLGPVEMPLQELEVTSRCQQMVS